MCRRTPCSRPLKIKSMTVPNRIVMAPVTRSFSPGGVPTSDVAAYYERRAANAVGLIVSEGAGVAGALSCTKFRGHQKRVFLGSDRGEKRTFLTAALGRLSPLGSGPKLSVRGAVARQARTESLRRRLNFCSMAQGRLCDGPFSSVMAGS